MPDKTFANAGYSLEEYKAMINKMMRALTGRDANFTDEQWQEEYAAFVESAKRRSDDDPYWEEDRLEEQ